MTQIPKSRPKIIITLEGNKIMSVCADRTCAVLVVDRNRQQRYMAYVVNEKSVIDQIFEKYPNHESDK